MAEHHRLPHLRPFARDPTVFLTVVTHGRRAMLANQIAIDVLTEIWRRSPEIDGWSVGDFLLMPDHLHLFARGRRDGRPLAGWVKVWKSVSSRRLVALLGREPPIWQRDYFDRFLRTADDYSRKWDYVAANPVRAGLCEAPHAWPWRGRLCDLSF